MCERREWMRRGSALRSGGDADLDTRSAKIVSSRGDEIKVDSGYFLRSPTSGHAQKVLVSATNYCKYSRLFVEMCFAWVAITAACGTVHI